MARYYKNPKSYMALDQYGEVVHDLTHPRKELSERFPGRVSKMYEDMKDGTTIHCGYVVGPLWFMLYEVQPFRKPV